MSITPFFLPNDLSDYCRVCLKLPDKSQYLDLTTIYDEEDNLTYGECFFICTQIDLNAGDGVPHYLCKSCGLELQMAYDFLKKLEESKRMIEESQRRLEKQKLNTSSSSGQTDRLHADAIDVSDIIQLDISDDDDDAIVETSQEIIEDLSEMQHANEQEFNTDAETDGVYLINKMCQSEDNAKLEKSLDKVSNTTLEHKKVYNVDGDGDEEKPLEIEDYQNLEALDDEEKRRKFITNNKIKIETQGVVQKIKIKAKFEDSTEICNEHISSQTIENKNEFSNEPNKGQGDRIKDGLDNLNVIYIEISDDSNDNEQIEGSQAVVANRNIDEIKIENETLMEYIVTSSPHKQDNPKSSSVVCDVCGKIEPNKRALLSHRYRNHKDSKRLRRAKGEKVVCSFCSSVFKRSQDLRFHIDSLHSDTIHNCPYCDYYLNTRNALYKHIASRHRDIKRHKSKKEHKCSQCGEILETVRKLKTHTAVHHVKKRPVKDASWLQCKDCGQQFKSRGSLHSHRFRKHNNKKKCLHQCDYCELMFPSYMLLEEHQLSSHKVLAALKQSVDKL